MESDHDEGNEQGASQVTPRSYECNFCKRGFSNAQALGGHMNIHRKDKAKLKQQSSSSSSNQTHQPSLDIHHHHKSSSEERSKLNWNWNVSQQDHTEIHMRQLSLFAESPTSTELITEKPQGQTEGALLSDQGGSSAELDLELRLGPEPQDSSAPTTGTRKFF